jgi:nicotinamidase-related amidase
MTFTQYPLPAHFNPDKVGKVWRVSYEDRAREAVEWSKEHCIHPASQDGFKLGLLLIDVQNTFCIPGFELYVGGRSGLGAVEDNERLCQFIYHNLGNISEISVTMDTHNPFQIFHAMYLVDEAGNQPAPMTLISSDDVRSGKWKFNTALAAGLGIQPEFGQRHLEHYVLALEEHHKYNLTIWPYHALLGGIGHALVAAVEEAIFFHSIARVTLADYLVKGDNPLTEHYSAVGPEVLTGPEEQEIAQKDTKFIEKLQKYNALVIAGQAKSHCVAWTISDLLGDILEEDESLVKKVYLLEDCTSPVVVPGIVDYTEEADAAFQRFQEAGMHVVRSIDPIESWLAMVP